MSIRSLKKKLDRKAVRRSRDEVGVVCPEGVMMMPRWKFEEIDRRVRGLGRRVEEAHQQGALTAERFEKFARELARMSGRTLDEARQELRKAVG